METLTVREFRSNLAEAFTKADDGEPVLIRRKKEIYALVKIGKENVTLTQDMQQRIAEVTKVCDNTRSTIGASQEKTDENFIDNNK